MKSKFIPSILIVDDSQLNRNMLFDAFQDDYAVELACDGVEALAKIKNTTFDIIISDIIMPNMDGLELYKILQSKQKTKNLPVIFVTAVGDVTYKIQLLELGAFDYITKPFNILELKARIKNHVSHIETRNKLQANIKKLNNQILKQNEEVDKIYSMFYDTIVNMAIVKSKETGLHLVRTKYYVDILLKKYMQIYKKNLNLDHVIENIAKAATMHDIGKIGIPDNILMKPGKLTANEFEIMKQHTVIGYGLLNSEKISIDNEVLRYAKEIAYSHHERWDGAGYPEGLAGESIPFSARIMAICDVYDALVSERIYKPAMNHEDAVKIIYKESGHAFDPTLIDLFLNEQNTIEKIAKEYQDKLQ